MTVAPKYNYNCVYIFHTIYPEKENWRTVLLQKNIYNIFLPTVPLNSVRKILEGACIRKASKYIPQASHFIELANRNDKVCLTLDCSNTNKDGPGRFWTAADNPDFQSCYFNSANDEQVYNEFISERVKNDVSHDNFYFKISELKSKTKKEKTFNASNKLRQLSKNDAKRSKSRTRTSFGAGSRSSGLSADRRNGLSNFDSTSGDVSSDAAKKHNEKFKKELNQDFFSSDNVIIPKKTIKKRSFNNYSPTKVKARSFLINILYNRVKDEDFNNRSFIIDCYSFILLYLNPFYLDRKFENSVEKDYVEALWQLQIPNDFYVFICRPENYKILNKLKLKFQETSEIVKTYADDLIGYQQLQTSFKQNTKVIQYAYANLFLRYFCRIDDYDVGCKLEFDSVYKQYLAQKNVLNWQFYNQNVVKCEETSSNQNKVDETEEQKDFRFEKSDIAKETRDGTIKEIVKKRKRLHQWSEKQLKKNSRKKLKLMADLEENKKKIDQIKSK